VPPGEEELIFRMFRQGSNAARKAAYGSGIGLYIARRIAREHGGDVALVDGRPERTTFALSLPRTWNPARPPSARRRPRKRRNGYENPGD